MFITPTVGDTEVKQRETSVSAAKRQSVTTEESLIEHETEESSDTDEPTICCVEEDEDGHLFVMANITLGRLLLLIEMADVMDQAISLNCCPHWEGAPPSACRILAYHLQMMEYTPSSQHFGKELLGAYADDNGQQKSFVVVRPVARKLSGTLHKNVCHFGPPNS